MVIRRQIPSIVIGVLLAVLLVAGSYLVRTVYRAADDRAVIVPMQAVMGTEAKLVIVRPEILPPTPGQSLWYTAAAEQAEQVIRNVEALMSSYIEASEISLINTAEAGEPVDISAMTFDVLDRARDAQAETRGTFDITVRPLIELWRQAGDENAMPTTQAIEQARTASQWSDFAITPQHVTKARTTARVDLGGIAKGYAIDRAAAVLREAEMPGGLIDIGGDIYCFGQSVADDGRWSIGVRHPREDRMWFAIKLDAAAVCTSGNYARYSEIEDQRFSHIIDPRTGRPTDASYAVTVVGPDATTADIWATALSVLGPDGLSLLGADLHAMLVTADDTHETGMKVWLTPGFENLLTEDARNQIVDYEVVN